MQKKFLYFREQPFVVLVANGSGGKSPDEEAALAVDRMGKELENLGASLEDVVRTTVFTKNQECRPAVSQVRRKAFPWANRPASSSIIVHHFPPEDTIVEIEATAFLPAGKEHRKEGIEFQPPRPYLKALRVENLLFLSGGGGSGDNIKTQTETALERIGQTMAELGSSWDKVLLLSGYVKKYEWFDLVAKLAREKAGSRPPIELFSADEYANPEMLLEVEATAYL